MCLAAVFMFVIVIMQLSSARDDARRLELDVKRAQEAVQQRDGEIQRLHASLSGRPTVASLPGGAGVRTSLAALSGFDSRASQNAAEDHAAIAASNARIIAQLNEQVRISAINKGRNVRQLTDFCNVVAD